MNKLRPRIVTIVDASFRWAVIPAQAGIQWFRQVIPAQRE